MRKKSIQIYIPDTETFQMLKSLASEDKRTLGITVALLIRQEYARRYSQPNPLVTVDEAIRAGQTIKNGGE